MIGSTVGSRAEASGLFSRKSEHLFDNSCLVWYDDVAPKGRDGGFWSRHTQSTAFAAASEATGQEERGLTPKLFGRIRRFQEVLRLIGRGQRVEWAEIALACGYFDQAHFIHDFRDFSGLNPRAYLTQRGEHLNHVRLRD